jgi:hypothetical protein
MEPAVDRREHEGRTVDPSTGEVAAMEPAVDRREHGSQNLSRLSCADRLSRERLMKLGSRICSIDLSRCKIYRLTCVRALPGIGVTTSALAAQMMTAPDEGSLS